MKTDRSTEAAKTINYLAIIEAELKALKIVEDKLIEEKKKVILQHNLVTLQKQKRNVGKKTDSRGEEINVGDIVRFNTKGGFRANKGRVIRFTKHFVIAVDDKKSEIRRHPSNVTVLSKRKREE